MKAIHYTACRVPQIYAFEDWGGATFDVAYRFLDEDPWERLRKMREAAPNILFQMLTRGANTVGYTNYPPEVVRQFLRLAAKNGVDVFRIFDCLNQLDHMTLSIDEVRKQGKLAETAFCYTGDILNDGRQKYTLKYYTNLAKEMEKDGERLAAIRIDSGDLAKLSKETRAAFDAAGLGYVKISVSNDLDEYTIQSLFSQGAPIDSFGVGTKLATCDPQPSLGGVYKLSAVRASSGDPWSPVIKLSEMAYKRTVPGVQHIRRFYDASGCPVGDMLVDDSVSAGPSNTMLDILDTYVSYDLEGEPRELLQCVVEHGHRAGEQESIMVARERCREAIMHLDPAIIRFLNPQIYPVGLELGLARLRHDLANEERAASGRPTID